VPRNAALPRAHPEVAEALADGRPVVALESTLIAHGLPRPGNLDAARSLEAAVREEGAVPATIAVLDGVPHVGLEADQLERIAAAGEDVRKLASRDLAPAAAARIDGATTVSATSAVAAAVGVAVFATGGLGGVHREARETWDESADLVSLATTPVAVVCSGVKSILDVAATLERLESLGVPVLGYGTNRFAGFYLTDSGHDLDWRADSPSQAADVIRAQRQLGSPAGLVVANPLPPDEQLDPSLHDRVLEQGLDALRREGVRGKAVTPFLLDWMHERTAGESLRVNVALVERNARLAARIALALHD
jgi:pseudouridine-5'-phosphate glycosidase